MRAAGKFAIVMAMAALTLNAAPRPDVQASIAILAGADGGTDHELVASALDAIRRAPDPHAAAAVAKLLRHQSRLYANRDKQLVVRLRAYALATLADTGVPDEALPAVLEILANLDQRMAPAEAGAAARAAGSVGTRGRPFIEHLVTALSEVRFDVEEFSLERYQPLYPPGEATTVRLEAIRALGNICTASDSNAIDALTALTTDAYPRVAREARRAVTAIQNRRSS